MASFDIESLFTQVPLYETSDIIINQMDDNTLNQAGLTKSVFSKLLKIATEDSVFTFREKIYSQIDGVAMGSPLSCSYANAFLCHWEKIWLENCPLDFKPLYYRRYVDDTFLIFERVSQVYDFLNFLNAQHPNIRFTVEIESNNMLPFLDVSVIREGSMFHTTVFRKPTFTGLGLNYLSFSPVLYKVNCIKTLITRAYNICSNYSLLNSELDLLKSYFINNAFPICKFFTVVKAFFNEKFTQKELSYKVPKDVRYIKLPYMGRISYDVRKQFKHLFRDAFPQIDFRFIFTNSLTIGSFLRKSDTLPDAICSQIVYLFTCSSCNARYVGSSHRWLSHRIAEHEGRSIRTGYPLKSPSFSAIREHSLANDHRYSHHDFKILTKVSNPSDLLITEALFVNKLKPELNGNIAPFQLYTQ